MVFGNPMDIVHILLTQGIYKGDPTEFLNEINKSLRPLFYEAVVLYDRSCCILKNNSNKFISSEYTEQDNLEIKKVIECVVGNKPVESYIVESLVANNWLERTPNGLELSSRCLIQFEEYILDLDGRYKRCSVCKQLVDGEDVHKYCHDLLNK